jgi:cytochrome c556
MTEQPEQWIEACAKEIVETMYRRTAPPIVVIIQRHYDAATADLRAEIERLKAELETKRAANLESRLVTVDRVCKICGQANCTVVE